MQQKGYSLIELTVVLGIIAIMGIVFSMVFISIVTGRLKAEIAGEIKENGEYALSTMEQVIRNSKPSPICNGQSVQIQPVDRVPPIQSIIFSCSNNALTQTNDGSTIELINSSRVVVDDAAGSCLFTCIPGDQVRPAGVQIFFRLRQAQTATRQQDSSMQEFQTTVFQRTYGM